MEIGSIVIPKGQNREDFISYCFNKERFSVLTNKRGMIDKVPCLHNVISDIKFPKDDKSLGSQVIVEYLEDYNSYVIIGTLSKIGCSLYNNEETLFVEKTYEGVDSSSKGNSIGMLGNSLLSKLTIFCKNVNKKISELYINCFGDKDSKLLLSSSGWVIVNSSSGLRLRYKDSKEISILDDTIQIFFSKEQKLTIKNKELVYEDGTNTFKIDNSGYNLGNINFKDYINKILDFLGNDICLLTSMGPTATGCSSTSSAAKLNSLKQELTNINNK